MAATKRLLSAACGAGKINRWHINCSMQKQFNMWAKQMQNKSLKCFNGSTNPRKHGSAFSWYPPPSRNHQPSDYSCRIKLVVAIIVDETIKNSNGNASVKCWNGDVSLSSRSNTVDKIDSRNVSSTLEPLNWKQQITK